MIKFFSKFTYVIQLKFKLINNRISWCFNDISTKVFRVKFRSFIIKALNNVVEYILLYFSKHYLMFNTRVIVEGNHQNCLYINTDKS